MDTNKSLRQIVTWLFSAEPMEPPGVQHRARLLFLDTLGCMIAGLAKPEPQAMAASLAQLEPGPIRLPGTSAPRSLNSAA